jgi:hypothetical protein
MAKIQKSKAKGKKYKVEVDGKTINFGAKGYRIKPGTEAGDSYCARSAGIRGRTIRDRLIIGRGSCGVVRVRSR